MFKFKPIKIHFRLDSDRDNVLDFKDCRPFNPRFQHISDTTKERIKHQPIYVSDRPDEEWHVLSKEARYKAPRARQEMLSAIKKYPSILGDFERAKAHEDIKYRFVHTSWKRPISIAEKARESIYFDKAKIDMDIGVQPIDSLRNLRPFVERYKVRQAEGEADIIQPYEIEEELPPEAYDFYNPFEEKRSLATRSEKISSHRAYKPVSQVKIGTYNEKILTSVEFGPKRWKDIVEEVMDIRLIPQSHGGYHQDTMTVGTNLRRLENTGLIERPKRGLYKITEKGKMVLKIIDDERVWKNPEYGDR